MGALSRSSGLDQCLFGSGIGMVAVPSSTTAETLAAICRQMAIGVMNNKTTAVNYSGPGRVVGEIVEFGGRW